MCFVLCISVFYKNRIVGDKHTEKCRNQGTANRKGSTGRLLSCKTLQCVYDWVEREGWTAAMGAWLKCTWKSGYREITCKF